MVSDQVVSVLEFRDHKVVTVSSSLSTASIDPQPFYCAVLIVCQLQGRNVIQREKEKSGTAKERREREKS